MLFCFRSVSIHKFHQYEDHPSCFQTNSLSSHLPHVQMGQLSSGQKEKLERLIYQCPDILNEILGLTHIMEYEIQLVESTPVRLTPY